MRIVLPMRRLLTFGVIVTLACAGLGCGGKLETGYRYRPLGESQAQRRAYYAGPFSPEAREAQMERFQEQGRD